MALYGLVSGYRNVDTDLIILVDASKSVAVNAFTVTNWNVADGTPSVVGGNGKDTVVLQYASAGIYDVIATIDDDINADQDIVTVSVNAAELPSSGDFGGNITISDEGGGISKVSSTDMGTAVLVEIYWGSTYGYTYHYDMSDFTGAGVTHEFSHATTRVYVYDENHSVAVFDDNFV